MQSNKPFTSQLRFIKLADALPYEILQALVTNSFSPYFKLVQSLLDFLAVINYPEQLIKYCRSYVKRVGVDVKGRQSLEALLPTMRLSRR